MSSFEDFSKLTLLFPPPPTHTHTQYIHRSNTYKLDGTIIIQIAVSTLILICPVSYTFMNEELITHTIFYKLHALR